MSDSTLNPHTTTRRHSRLAIFALVLALVPCCPMVSLLGGTLGLIAWRQIRRSSGRLRGETTAKAAAFTGMAVGLLTLIAFTWIQTALLRNLDAAIVRQTETFIHASQQGDQVTARATWDHSALTPTGPEMTAFGQTLHSRYGRLQRFTITSQVHKGVLQPTLEVAGLFVFERNAGGPGGGGLLGFIKFEIHPQLKVVDPELLITEIKIEDPDSGDLALP
jgi:hypothetical protein